MACPRRTSHYFSIVPSHEMYCIQSDFLASVYGGLFSVFISSLYHAMESLPNLKNSEIQPFLSVLETVRDSGLLERFDVDIHARFNDVEQQVRRVSGNYYETKIQQLQSAPGVNRALPLLLMTDELEKSAKLLSKRFPDPLFGYIRPFLPRYQADVFCSQVDLVSLVVGVQVPLFVGNVLSSQKRLFESSMNGPTPDVPIQDIFTLYRRTKMLLDMHTAFCPQCVPYAISTILNVADRSQTGLTLTSTWAPSSNHMSGNGFLIPTTKQANM